MVMDYGLRFLKLTWVWVSGADVLPGRMRLRNERMNSGMPGPRSRF